MSLTGCLRKAGDALRPEDKSAVLAAAAKYRKEGMKPDDAARQAVEDQLASVRGMMEAQAESAATMDQSAYTGGYETDLFGNPLPEAQRSSQRARPAAAGVHGNAQPEPNLPSDTPAPDGQYSVRTTVGAEAQRKLGAKSIKSAADVAAATRYLYRSAVERFDGIVTDADGKPLAVIGGFKGALAQASVYPATLMGEATRVPGAARVWFSHNHPSGGASLSTADKRLNEVLVDVFLGSGIEPMGLLAIGSTQYSHVDPKGSGGSIEDIPASTGEMAINVIERQLAGPSDPSRPAINSPQDAKDQARAYYKQARQSGILLLDSQHRVAAWVPLPSQATGKLRNTGGSNAIYRAVSEANAGAALIVHGGELNANIPGKSVTLGQNIGAALSKVDVRALDIIDANAGTSAAEQGLAASQGPLYQGADTPRAQITFPSDLTAGESIISLLKGADLSSFIHESGHFFLEVQTDLAVRIQQQIDAGGSVTDLERGIVEDAGKLLDWFAAQDHAKAMDQIEANVKAAEDAAKTDPNKAAQARTMREALEWANERGREGYLKEVAQTWAAEVPAKYRMTLLTPYHETFARGFELYAFEGKAPTFDMQPIFSRFAAWIRDVYRVLTNTLGADALQVKLTDDVRAVMGRMLATDQAIEEAEAQRGMMPMVKSFEDAQRLGWDKAKYDEYHATARATTDKAAEELQARSMKDMRWFSGAKNKALKARQQEVEAQRREILQEIRGEVYREPVYRAWQFLTGRGDPQDKAAGTVKAKASTDVDAAKDSLLVAIAKLGGINRESAKRDLSVSDDDLKMKPEVFGKPVFRKEGGRNVDDMREALTELGYLFKFDEFGRTEIRELADLVSEEIGGSPQYSAAYDYAQAMGDTTAQALPDEAIFGKLDTAELRDRYGTGEQAIWRKLSAQRMTSEKDGISSDVLAETIVDENGQPAFDSGDALVKALAEAMPPREVIEARTDQRMLEMFGDISSPQALERAADEAVHNEARARFIAAELKALQDANKVRGDTGRRTSTGRAVTVNVMAKAAKEYAQQIVARLRIRDIRPGQYKATEARNAKLAEKALGGAKLEEAAMHKRNQLFNNYAAKFAMDAQAEVKSVVAYFRKFEKFSKTIDPEYQDQIANLLEPFDFKPASLKAIDKRKSFATWYAEQVADGLEPNVPPELLALSAKQSHRDMNLEELRGLADAVKQIEHMGRLKNRLLKARGKRELDAMVAEMAESIRASKPERNVPRQGQSRVMDAFDSATASLRKLSSLVRQMDMGRDDGPLYEGIIRGANESEAMENVRLRAELKAVAPLFTEMAALPGGLAGKKTMTPLGVSLDREGRLAVLLNTGNADNLQRLEGGDGWTMADFQALASTMTVQELAFVNKVWTQIDSLWPEVAALEKRVKGVVPEKVEAQPWTATAADGTHVVMSGGYYPLAYDASKDPEAAKNEAKNDALGLENGAATRAMTRHGHTQERAKKVDRKLRLDLGVATKHIQQVVHDLAWREWVIDTNKILNHKEFSESVFNHYGSHVHTAMLDAAKAVAAGEVEARTFWDKTMLHFRSNVSRAIMGFSFTTSFLQPFGLLQTWQRIGLKHVVGGMKHWAGGTEQMEGSMKAIQEKSLVMRERANNLNREINEITRATRNKWEATQVFDTAAFFMLQKLQAIADVPTWLGQYEKTRAEMSAKAEAEGRTGEDVDAEIEAAAIAQADRAVKETQSSGGVLDLSAFQRNHPMLTMFYSYFSATWNLMTESTAKTNFKSPASVAGWMADMMLLTIVPALGPALLMAALRGGDDDEDGWLKEGSIEVLTYMMAMIPLVRDASGIAKGYDYTGPPAAMLYKELQNVLTQTKQGEVDEAFVRAYARAVGVAFGLPVVQLNRSYRGWKAWAEGEEGAGPQSILFGPPPKD